MSRKPIMWVLAALLGIVLTAGITWATSQLTSQRIGLASEPISAGARLAPREGTGETQVTRTSPGTGTSTRSHTPARTHSRSHTPTPTSTSSNNNNTTTTTVTVTSPPATPAPVRKAAPREVVVPSKPAHPNPRAGDDSGSGGGEGGGGHGRDD